MKMRQNTKSFVPLENAKRKDSLSGFTLMELMTVVVIVGIIAAFAIPSYENAVARAHEKDAVLNLRSIAAAEAIYKSERGKHWPADVDTGVTYHYVDPPNGTPADINQGLHLNIIQNGILYQCLSWPSAPWLDFDAIYPRPPQATKWTIRLQTNILTGEMQPPYCLVAGTCPTCTPSGCP